VHELCEPPEKYAEDPFGWVDTSNADYSDLRQDRGQLMESLEHQWQFCLADMFY